MELIIPGSSTAIMIASLKYWYPLICAGTPISCIISVTSFSRSRSTAGLGCSCMAFCFFSFFPEGTVIMIWNSLSPFIRSPRILYIFSLSFVAVIFSCSIKLPPSDSFVTAFPAIAGKRSSLYITARLNAFRFAFRECDYFHAPRSRNSHAFRDGMTQHKLSKFVLSYYKRDISDTATPTHRDIRANLPKSY